MKKFLMFHLLVILLTMTACTKPFQESEMGSTCIQPATNFAFQIKELPAPTPTEPILAKDWEYQTDLPNSFRSRQGVYFQNDLWLIGYNASDKQAILRYSPTTKTWKEYYDLQDEDSLAGAFFSLYVSLDDSLWGMMSPPLSPTDSISLPLNGVSPISHYNEQTDSFEYVVDKNTALSTRIGRIYEIAGDENGSIWFSTNEGLYEYIQNQSLVKMHIQTTKKDALQLVTATETGTIWAIRGGKNTLFRYTPTHNAVIEYPVPSIFLSDQTHNGLDQLNKIYIDSKNNLWLDDLGWVELDSLKSLDAVDIENQVWYQVIRSPVFITDQGGAFHYTWQRPTLAFDDADGFIWFNSPAGVVRLDKQNGNWCKTATSGFVIMGGSSNNPWLILGTELYTYSAKQ